MVKITKITVQKRNKSRYNIFLDRGQGEEYAFSVDEDVLIRHRLTKGLELDESQLMKMVDQDEERKAYFLAINYLSYRMRSIGEVRAYLHKKEREERHIEAVIKQLLEERLLNDEEFALAYVNTKKRTTLTGPVKLSRELREKEVKSTHIENALEAFSVEDQVEQLMTWFDKQKSKQGKQSNKAFIDKLRNQLLRRGFTHSIIFEALKGVDFEKDDTDEWEAICHQGERLLTKLSGKYSEWEVKQRVKQSLYRKGFTFDMIDRFLDEHNQANENM